MIPLVVSVVGIGVSLGCLYLLWRAGSAVWKRKMREAAARDRRTFGDDEQVG